MAMIRHALIMAAGRGSRMMPLTAVTPKAMAPYAGSTLIRSAIRHIRSHIPNIHVTVGYKGAMLAEHVIESQVSSLFNTDGQGNAWWVYNTPLSLIDEPVLVLTCDIIFALDFAALEEEFARCGEPACMILPVTPAPERDGDYLFREGNVIVEISRSKRSEVYSSGIQILNPAAVNRLTRETDDFTELWRQLMQQKQVLASSVQPTEWLTFDTISHLLAAGGG